MATPQDDSLLNSLKDSLVNAVNSGSLDVGSPILGMETKVVALPNEVPEQPGDEENKIESKEKDSKTGLIIAIIIGVAVLIVGIVIGCKLKKKLSKMASLGKG